MSDFSTNLKLPYLMPAQAQKHVTVNEALRRLDALCQANAVSMSVSAQPGGPDDGSIYILPPGKTGAQWDLAGDWSIGIHVDGAWEFVAPKDGWMVWVADEGGLFAWDGAAWNRVDIVTTETVRAAGAAMEDAFASLGNVKAINQDLSTGGAPNFHKIGFGTGAATSGYAAYGGVMGETDFGLRINASHAAYASEILLTVAMRAADPAFSFVKHYSNAGDPEFDLRGDGNGFCDGAFSGGGADYAEFFEWADGNPEAEDRAGYPVVHAGGGRIRIATAADDPAAIIGAISRNPTIVGDAAWNRWSGKYLRDPFGGYVMEDYQTVAWSEPDAAGRPVTRSYALEALPAGVTPPGDAQVATQRRRALNPAFDPEADYAPREARPEWDAVGVMGKLRLRTGQPAGERWIKLRDISDAVQEWLVR